MAGNDMPRDYVVRVLQNIVRNDATHYEHHEARGWDGRTPEQVHEEGTIWLTPKEIATHALRRLGADVPNAIEEALATAEEG